MDIDTTLSALEALSSSPSSSSSGPLNALLEDHFANARQRISAGEDPKGVISELQKNVVKAKKEVDKGLRKWYAVLGTVGTAVDKVCALIHSPATYRELERGEANGSEFPAESPINQRCVYQPRSVL
jgi:hypothetical protein